MAKTSRAAKDTPAQPAPAARGLAAGSRAAADLAAGRRVMAQARAGIAALEESLGAAFLACLDMIGGISGGSSYRVSAKAVTWVARSPPHWHPPVRRRSLFTRARQVTAIWA